jgi:ribosomal protein L11 methyltransferase
VTARYIEIAVGVAERAAAERAADVLRAITEGGVSIEQPFRQPDLESEATLDERGLFRVYAYLPADSDRGGALLAAKRELEAARITADLTARIVADEDWAEAWKEHFHVERYGKRLVVAPSWRRHEALADDIVIRLDPGMAFGTGQHETTRMCLEALEDAVRPGDRVLDVGCGSGILAIAAAKLGASEVYAVDIDPTCVRITSENAAANGVSIQSGAGTLGDAWPFAPPPSGFDVVAANIIAPAIIEMAADLHGTLRPGGILIASGILTDRRGEVLEALASAGFGTIDVRTMGEWDCASAVRP